jgi:oxazoline/thiazoline dehydrogenase
MSHQLVLSFKDDVDFIEEPGTKVTVLLSSDYRITFKSTKSGLRNVLYSLKNENANLDKLYNLLEVDEGILAVTKLNSYLEKFSQLGWLCHSCFADKNLVATAIPVSRGIQFENAPISIQSRYILSRFAYLHRIKNQMILESPLSRMQIQLFSWQGTAILTQLVKPHNCVELAVEIPGLYIDFIKQFLSLLMHAQMLSELLDSNTSEIESTALAQWEFHDLLFHTRSQLGRHSNSVGGNYRFLGEIDPLPVIKPVNVDSVIDLYKPDLELLKKTDVPFTQVLEKRKSIYEFGDNLITINQIGEFLYRVARVKEITQTPRGEVASCPYPSAGSLYELELYLVINQCERFSSGFYYYHPLNHQLHFISEITKNVDKLVKNTSKSLGGQATPQVIIIITARFQRVAWKYEGIAYSLILKNVGALYQTMYLVATAMNLAPCAVGLNNADLFAEVLGCDYYVETSVGEFTVSSKLM